MARSMVPSLMFFRQGVLVGVELEDNDLVGLGAPPQQTACWRCSAANWPFCHSVTWERTGAWTIGGEKPGTPWWHSAVSNLLQMCSGRIGHHMEKDVRLGARAGDDERGVVRRSRGLDAIEGREERLQLELVLLRQQAKAMSCAVERAGPSLDFTPWRILKVQVSLLALLVQLGEAGTVLRAAA